VPTVAVLLPFAGATKFGVQVSALQSGSAMLQLPESKHTAAFVWLSV
jgi:hypothetical protein